MSEQYIDPNSGAAPQPGGIFIGGHEGAAAEPEPEAPTVPDTEPGAPAEGETPEAPEAPEGEAPEAPEGEGEEPGGEAEGEVGVDSGDEGAPAEGFNPSDHTVAEVLAYIAENPDQKDAVIAAEKAGKNRTTVVSA